LHQVGKLIQNSEFQNSLWNKANFFDTNIEATNGKGFDLEERYFYKLMKTATCLALRIKLS